MEDFEKRDSEQRVKKLEEEKSVLEEKLKLDPFEFEWVNRLKVIEKRIRYEKSLETSYTQDLEDREEQINSFSCHEGLQL